MLIYVMVRILSLLCVCAGVFEELFVVLCVVCVWTMEVCVVWVLVVYVVVELVSMECYVVVCGG